MNPQVKKTGITVLKILGVIIIVFILIVTLISFAFEGKIKSIAISELNKRLSTEVQVKGEVTLSLFSNFPYASLQFNDVDIKESLPEKGNLLSCKKISLLFNVWDLIGSNYKLVKTIVSDGTLDVHLTADGSKNWNIFKSAPSDQSSSFSLQIEKAILSNILVNYNDDRSGHHYIFQTDQSALSGNFSSSKFLLTIQSELLSRQLMIDSVDYLPNRKASLDCQLNVDLDKNIYTFTNGAVDIEGNQLGITGTVQSLDDANHLDLQITGKDLRIENLAALLPSTHAKYFSQFTSKGNIGFKLSIEGNSSARETPEVTCEFGMNDATISHADMKTSFEHVNLTGTYSNGSQKNLASSSVELKSFSTSLQGNLLNGSLIVRNFRNPNLDVRLNGKLSLKNLAPLLETDVINELDGTIAFQQFYFSGNVNQLADASSLNKIDAGGDFLLDNLKVTTSRATYDHINGNLAIRDNQISFQQLSFHAQNSDLHFDGTLTNLIPYLVLAWSDQNTERDKISASVTLTSHTLNWEDLVGINPPSAQDSSQTSFAIPSIFYILLGNIQGNVDHFTYQKFNADNIHGSVTFPGQVIFFNDLGMNIENGTLLANGKLDIVDANHSRLDMTATLNQIDITKLFYEFDNFGQQTLTDKNLKGSLTSNVALQSIWHNKHFDPSQLHAVADVTIENGELNSFDPMLALSKFVKIDELKNIRFSRLQNQVEIKNRTVFIPTTTILTNALNVQLSGTHTFDNIIDYKVQLNLLQFLTTRFHKTNFDPGNTDESTQGFLNLYLSMTGPASNPSIRYDKQRVKEEISQGLKEEKGNLKDALNKEFGKQPNDQQPVKDWKAPAEIQYMEFENDSTPAKTENNPQSPTKQNQQKALDNFKDIFKPKSTPK